MKKNKKILLIAISLCILLIIIIMIVSYSKSKPILEKIDNQVTTNFQNDYESLGYNSIEMKINHIYKHSFDGSYGIDVTFIITKKYDDLAYVDKSDLEKIVNGIDVQNVKWFWKKIDAKVNDKYYSIKNDTKVSEIAISDYSNKTMQLVGLPLSVTLIIIVSCCFFVTFVIMYSKNSKTSSKEGESLISKAKKYCDESEVLLERYKADDDYLVLKDALEKIPSVYNQYGLEVLGVKKLPKSSLDPYVAAALGNAIGGFPCGIYMGLSAYEKKEQQKQEHEEFDRKYRIIKSTEQKLKFLVGTIDNIVSK